tara:strand:+ start:6724 stop:8055 length:1332 start_codon:yes stop_codon:yes gene_type:complete
MKLNETLFDIEQRFVAAIFHDADVLDLLDRANLDYEIIENDFLRSILKLCMAERSKGDLVDMPKLRRQMFLDGGVVPDKSEFMELIDAADTSFHAIEDFKLIVTDYKRRATLTHALILQTLANDKDWEENQAKAKGVMQSINEIDIAEKPLSHRDRAKASLKNRQNIVDGKIGSEAVRIETGIYCIDRYCRPLSTATGDFNCLLFAATSTGKSSLMAQIVSHNTFRNLNVAVFLGETNYEGLLEQMAGQMSKCSIDEYDFKSELPHKQKKYMESLEDIASHCGDNLFIYDDRFFLEDIVTRCKKLEQETRNLDLVVIDHMHCLKTRQKFTDERLKFNYISGALKPLGIEMKCPILCLAQPSRGLKSSDRPPMLSDLKESGNLEDDADRVWALWMPPIDTSGNPQERKSSSPEIKLFQLKFRRGRVTDVNLKFDKQFTLFSDNQ